MPPEPHLPATEQVLLDAPDPHAPTRRGVSVGHHRGHAGGAGGCSPRLSIAAADGTGPRLLPPVQFDGGLYTRCTGFGHAELHGRYAFAWVDGKAVGEDLSGLQGTTGAAIDVDAGPRARWRAVARPFRDSDYSAGIEIGSPTRPSGPRPCAKRTNDGTAGDDHADQQHPAPTAAVRVRRVTIATLLSRDALGARRVASPMSVGRLPVASHWRARRLFRAHRSGPAGPLERNHQACDPVSEP